MTGITASEIRPVSLTRAVPKQGVRNLLELVQDAPSASARDFWAGILARKVNFTAR